MEKLEQMEMYFSLVKDKRNRSYIKYQLKEILFMMLCSVLAGFYDYKSIARFVQTNWVNFFSKYVKHHRPPCLNAIRLTFQALNPSEVDLCMQGIFRNVMRFSKRDLQQFGVDGKAICGSEMMIVTVFDVLKSLSVYHATVDSKTNEIPIVQDLIKNIDIKGVLLTLDALHTQKETLETIVEQGGEYLVPVKKNQRELWGDIDGLFRVKWDTIEKSKTVEKSHGRVEIRHCEVLPGEAICEEYFTDWIGIKKIFRITRTTEKDGKKTVSQIYYISSKNATASELLELSRNHWRVESMHWILDKVMNEDNEQLRNENAKICMNIMRKTAFSLLKEFVAQTKPKEKSINGNIQLCAISTDYLEKVLCFFFCAVFQRLCYFR